MNELIKSVSPEIIGGLLALASAIIGAKIATKANKQETKAKELREAYADVFSGYYACMVEMSGEDVYKLVRYRARLSNLFSKIRNNYARCNSNACKRTPRYIRSGRANATST